MPTVFDMLPDRFAELGDDRAIVMRQGFQRIGYDIKKCAGFCDPRDERDVLITWTVHKGPKQKARDRFEAAGGRVVVAEEAHLRYLPNGPFPGEQYFSLCLHDHQFQWANGGPDRWQKWNVALKPWRETGSVVLVRETRGIGSDAATCEPDWHARTAAKLSSLTTRRIELVEHPKKIKQRGEIPPTPEEQFADAWCVVTWHSHMATEALVHGIPVIALGPFYFLKTATYSILDIVDCIPLDDNRLAAFERFAWAQWSRTEIASGEAFARLLQ